MPWIMAVLMAIGITTAVVVSRDDQPPENTNQPTNPTTVVNDSGTPTANTNSGSAPNDNPVRAEPHPVSIPALMAMELDGRDLKLGAVQSDTASYTRYTISYRSGDLSISGIMNIPKGDGPFPVLILNHGYIDPAVYTNGRGLKREQDYLARQGFAVFHSDYRCHAQSDCDDTDRFELRLGYVKDVLNAVQAVKTSWLPQLDGNRIGMLGHSMGGGVALNVMVAKPDLVKAFVLFAPVSGDINDNFGRWVERRPVEAQRIIETYGTAEQNPSFWKNISPLSFYDRIAVPVLIEHGTADESVPLEWSDKLTAALKASGKDVTYHTYPGQPHEFTTAWGTVMQRTTEFFHRHVKG